jgi:HK97 family phage prohead protease
MKLNFTQHLTAADSDRRVIAGRIVTWGEVGNTSQGPTRFAKDSIELDDDVKLLREHDRSTPLGRATRITELEDGLEASFRIIGTAAGNDALVEASEQLRDGLSVGVEVLESEYDSDGTLVVTASRLDEVSLVHSPAIDSARVDRVAASEASPEEEAEPEEEEEEPMSDHTEDTSATEVEASHITPVAATRPRVEFSGAGEYLSTYVAAMRGDRDASRRIEAAVAADVLADVPGIVPTPIIGDLINDVSMGRPVVNSSRRLQMPAAGASFIRPIITQGTAVDKQAAELAELTSQKMLIDPITVPKETYGGVVQLSFQARDFTDPAIMGIVTSDLARRYAEQTEAVTCQELQGAVTVGEILATGDEIGSIYRASKKVADATGTLADTIWCSPDMWATLGGLTDTTGRPLFPTLSPMNAPGTSRATSWDMNPAGLRLVVSNGFGQEGVAIVGASRYLETYENVGGQLQATNVTNLSVDVAFYGYFAKLVAMGEAFVGLTVSGGASVTTTKSK